MERGGIWQGPGRLGLPPMCSWPPRPLIKLHIIWKKDGVPLSSGISDYSRRLTILHPALSDSGYYECEAVLRSSSVPAVAEGAFLSVLGEGPAGQPQPTRVMSWGGLSPRGSCWGGLVVGLGDPGADAHSWAVLCRATAVCQGAGEAHHSRDGEGGGHPLPSQR